MAWRKIDVDGVQFRYQLGTGAVVIHLPSGKKDIVPLSRLKHMSQDEIDRGRHKKTSSGMVCPDHIREYIQEEFPATIEMKRRIDAS